MGFEKRRKIIDKCYRKEDEYDAVVKLVNIETQCDGDIVSHIHSIAQLICINVDSAKDYDDIIAGLAEEVSYLLQKHKRKED